jgi:hypothetical protein
MLIIFGQRKKLHDLGGIEDYCPICRGLRDFEIGEHREVTHLYFVPIHTKSTGHFRKVCSSCRCEFPQRTNPLDTIDWPLQTETGIRRAQGATERAELDETLAREDMSPLVRSRLLREPFLALAAWVDMRKKSGELDVRATAAVVAIVLMFVVAIIAFAQIVYNNQGFSLANPYVWVMIGAAIGCGGGLWLARGITKRFVRKQVQPNIVQSLQPLSPSLEEIEEVIAELRTARVLIGKHIDPQNLCEAIMDADERDLMGELAP